jgi:hypothetical protein
VKTVWALASPVIGKSAALASMIDAQANALFPADFIVPSPYALLIIFIGTNVFIPVGRSTSSLNVCVYAFWALCLSNISLQRTNRPRSELRRKSTKCCNTGGCAAKMIPSPSTRLR